jgi:hypothetical protein
MESASVEAAKAGPPLESVGSSNSSMVESTEGAGMHSPRDMRAIEAMRRPIPAKAAAAGIGGMIEVRSIRMKIIAVDDSRAMRDKRVVVVDDSPPAVPVESPTVPTPGEAGK